MKQVFLHPRLFVFLGILIAAFLVAHLFSVMLPAAYIALSIFLVAIGLDAVLLFRLKQGVEARRLLPDRFSNGDSNPVTIRVQNRYRFSLRLTVIDEVPEQFQWRDMRNTIRLEPGETQQVKYRLRPVTRGEYTFGRLIVLARSPIRLLIRRYVHSETISIPVYPAFMEMQKYQLLAMSNRLTEAGIKPIRRLGHSSEFEQIKEYVRGDDYRTINWKATARSKKLMVNQYTDERSQQVYCLIDKSRVMKMPFEGMTLLDHSINATLVLTNIARSRHDKAGLITFARQIDQFLPAGNQPLHMRKIQELLYRQHTEFKESDYERLYAFVSRKIPHRSLMVLFTNFESQHAMRRQLPFLQRLAKQHLLLVVFFENTELTELLDESPHHTEGIYIKAIAEQFALEKKLIVKELLRHGIHSILTPPESLTANTINRYLEIKARSMI